MVRSLSRILSCLVAALLLPIPGATADQGRTDFELAFAEGVWAFSQYDYLNALEYFKKAHEKALDNKLPEDSFARYMLGLSHLRLGNAQEAVNEIAASLEADPPPPVPRSRILGDLGAAQLAAGNAQAAVDTLEKALRELKNDDPELPVALHHYATALAALGRQPDAEAARAQARGLDPDLDPEDLPITTPKVAEEARSGGGPPWSGSLSVTAGYDSNPNLLSEDLLLPLPSPGDEPVDGDSSDIALETDLQVHHGPGRLGGGWSLSFDLRGGGSFHHDFDYLDIARAGGAVRLDWERSRRWSLGLRSGAEQILLDRSSYLRLLDAGVALSFVPTAADVTRLEVSFLDRGYSKHQRADPRREGEEVRIGLRQIRSFGGQGSFVSLEVATADRSADPAFERTLWEGEVRAFLPIGKRCVLDLSGRLREEDFGDSESNLFDPRGPARDDRTWGTSAALSFAFSERAQAVVRGTYTERRSNVDLGEDLPDLDYRRTILGTGIVWSF
jgi:tetratricopeptide (TPR) repeat protein